MVQKEVKYPIGSGTRAHFTAPSKVLGKFLAHVAQWSEGVTKPPWSSEQIEVNLRFFGSFWVYFEPKSAFKHFQSLNNPLKSASKVKKCSKIRKFGNKVCL